MRISSINIFPFLMIWLAISQISCTNKTSPEEKKTVSSDTLLVGDQELAGLTEKIGLNPTDPDLYYKRALYFIDQADYSLALADLKSVFMMDTNNAIYFNTLGEVYLELKQIEPAEGAFEKAISVNDQYAPAFINRGKMHFYKKDYDDAFVKLNQGLKLNPNKPEGYFWKGMIYKETGNAKLTVSNLQTAIEQDPDYYPAYMELGLFYLAEKDEQALAYFTNALRVDSNSTEALYGRAYTYQNYKRMDEAKADYRSAIAKDSLFADAWFNLGFIAYDEQKYDSTVLCMSRANLINPLMINALQFRSNAYEKLGEIDLALSDMERVAALIKGDLEVQNAVKRLKEKQKSKQ